MTRSNQKPGSKIIDPDLLLSAYASGYFPMAESRGGEIRWYSPDPRAIIPLDRLKISRSLKQTLKKNTFQISVSTMFEDVMRRCAARKNTWISEDIVQSYLQLYGHGYAHSVECWNGDKLVGGLYGVALGGAFFGESMFSQVKDASKVALVHLVERLNLKKFELLDAQFITRHLVTLGAVEITRKEYLALLKKVIQHPCSFLD